MYPAPIRTNRPRSYGSSPPSSPDRAVTPISEQGSYSSQKSFPSDLPDTLAYHVNKIQQDLASKPPDSLTPGAMTGVLRYPHARTRSDYPGPFYQSIQPPNAQLAILRPPLYTLMKPSSASRPFWYSSLMEGIRSETPNQASTHALNLVKRQTWTYETFTLLVQWICWTASSPEPGRLASFVVVLFDKFGKYAGQEAGTSFSWHISEAVNTLFQSCWCSKHQDAISYSYAPSEAYVASATRFLEFTGQLYTHVMLNAQVVHDCIGALIEEMIAIEHIHAIRALLRAATKSLWFQYDSATIFHFITSFSTRTSMIAKGGRGSILGKPTTSNDIFKAATEVLDMVSAWKEELDATQRMRRHV